jgi:hypothetical protein
MIRLGAEPVVPGCDKGEVVGGEMADPTRYRTGPPADAQLDFQNG